MAYCDITRVSRHNPARTIGTSTHPNITQVNEFIDEAAGIIDGILAKNGYDTPIPTAVATSVQLILRNANAVGGAYYTEWAAPASDKREEIEDMWQTAQKMLATIELPGVPKGASSAGRSNCAPTAFFSRDMVL